MANDLAPGVRVSLRPGSPLPARFGVHSATVITRPAPFGVCVAVLDALYETTSDTDKSDTDPAVICELQLLAGRLAVAVPLEDVRVLEAVVVN